MKGEKWFIITLIVIIVLCVLKILSNNLDNFLLSILIYIWIFGTLFIQFLIYKLSRKLHNIPMQIESSVLKLFSYKMCLNFINISYIYEILSAYGACYLVVAA